MVLEAVMVVMSCEKCTVLIFRVSYEKNRRKENTMQYGEHAPNLAYPPSELSLA
jgi:hypothetical protein